MFPMSDDQFQTVYNVLSFSLASMMATTLFLWMRAQSVNAKYQTAVIISGLVTFIAAYHYMRIFNSWVAAYSYGEKNVGGVGAPVLTGVPFNDAYRYMDWLLTVPLLLIEIILVMKLTPEESSRQCWTLGIVSALMIISGYKGELIIEGNLDTRWQFWAMSMVPFLYIVYTLLVGLADATNAETDAGIKSLIQRAQLVTVISWCTYPVVYIFPMMGITGASAVVAIQVGYCVSDIISKCGLGLMIYQITKSKSDLEKQNSMLG